ncbi:unnamed protein product [Pieris brassicae]|uniref:Uncharacterized protein n=1 Tax=Pieris brassicae TaxID=7116 RepID=A0A9P0TNT7_PIEBR|nr:unnamed protein product [Pieris brassicae]
MMLESRDNILITNPSFLSEIQVILFFNFRTVITQASDAGGARTPDILAQSAVGRRVAHTIDFLLTPVRE